MKKISVYLIIIALASAGCGGKDKVKHSADYLVTQNILGAMDNIRDAYQRKDNSAISERVEPALSEAISKESMFETAELFFNPQMVKIIADSVITVKLIWRGTWVVNGKSINNRGVGVMTFQGDPAKLIKIDGDNPFLIPGQKQN